MANRTPEDPDIKDRKGTQPAKYHSGLSKSTKAKRDAHFKKGQKMDDNNPAAYKPAPGDASAKTKESKYTKKFKQMYGEEKMKEEIFEDTSKALKNKAEKSGVSVGILRKVYNRGVAAWRTGHRPGTTPEQWGMARVNSFLTGGKTRTTADADLWKKVRKEEYDATPGGHEWGTDKSVKLAKKKTPGEVKESMDPRDVTDDPGFVVTYQDKKEKENIKRYFPNIASAKKYAEKANKINRVGGKAKIYKTDGRKLMPMKEWAEIDEAVEFHVRLDHLDNDKRLTGAVDLLRKYEKSRKIDFESETNKGVIFSTKSKSVISQLDRELKKFATGAQMNEAVDPSDTGGAEEVSMAKKQIAAMRHYLDGIESSVKAKGDMEEWYQNKLTKANDYLKTLYGYAKGDVAEEVDLEKKYKKGDKVKVRVRGGKIDDYVIVGLDTGVSVRNRGKFWTAQRNGVGTNRMINVKDIVEESELDEATYKVDVEGLPVFYMNAASPEKVKTALRKLLRKASAIQDVDRVTPTAVRADYRDRIKAPKPDGDTSDDEV